MVKRIIETKYNDSRTPLEHLEWWANEAKSIPSELLTELKKAFSGEDTTDYYYGVLVGATKAWQLLMDGIAMKKVEQIEYVIKVLISFLANEVKDRLEAKEAACKKTS